MIWKSWDLHSNQLQVGGDAHEKTKRGIAQQKRGATAASYVASTPLRNP
jgi:hypothetical protein